MGSAFLGGGTATVSLTWTDNSVDETGFRVQAVNAGGASEWSNVVTVTTP